MRPRRLNNGQSATASIVVTATALGTYTNTVVVSSQNPDLVSGNNTATASTTVASPEIGLTPGSFAATQLPNIVTTQTLTITNSGPVKLNWLIGEQATLVTSNYLPEPNRTGIAADRFDVVNAADKKSDASLPGGATVLTPFKLDAVLYDNGPLVNGAGQGAGGADASIVQTALGLTTYGSNASAAAAFRMADDFVITGLQGWNISNITFFAYQTGSTISSTITSVNYRIWDGVPGAAGSHIVFGDTTTNRLIATTWSNSYRVLDTALTGATRPIMANTVSANVVLPPGHYWIDWQLDGSLASGPWAPPISINGTTTTGDAWQYDSQTALAWVPLLDGTYAQGLPFIIQGTLTCSDNIPWLSASPTSGTTSAGGSSNVNVQFNSTGLAAGVYTGTLCVASNDATDQISTLPVTLTVQPAVVTYTLYLPVLRR